MTKKADRTADEIAQLKKELAEVKAAQPKPQKSWEEMERERREWENEMHQLREGRMAYAIHPSVVRDMAGGVTEADCADLRRASHAPTGPTTMAPSSPPVVRSGGGGNVPGGGTGWSREIPIGPSMHQRYVDAQLDAADARDKAERVREHRLEALAKLAEADQPKAKGKP
jgi:hypothetical protein